MSPRNSDSNPSPDIYVGLLFVSFAALLGGITFLALALAEYDWMIAP